MTIYTDLVKHTIIIQIMVDILCTCSTLLLQQQQSDSSNKVLFFHSKCRNLKLKVRMSFPAFIKTKDDPINAANFKIIL